MPGCFGLWHGLPEGDALLACCPSLWPMPIPEHCGRQGRPWFPMAAGIGAVLVNLVLNYILIFGHFGVRAMGVRGAALATVVSRYVELAIVALWTHTHGGERALHPWGLSLYVYPEAADRTDPS